MLNVDLIEEELNALYEMADRLESKGYGSIGLMDEYRYSYGFRRCGFN